MLEIRRFFDPIIIELSELMPTLDTEVLHYNGSLLIEPSRDPYRGSGGEAPPILAIWPAPEDQRLVSSNRKKLGREANGGEVEDR